ncbi:adenylyltransferase and sulfurtransferase [Flavobacterium gillisiae]|uniref:Molybdopterin-synthase adenylyltransferase n=1 Tax=Flavobacterium gillisiae TaxID=150146 RepID=A0A1H3XEU4_9FLAO|nr:HesA/MoeB/ThiF family protein [Flavobacterium gillisiae]SDZ97927.1 adenylyltransferase and sulfurtransferase [Flavobacterium gillisiae]
MKNSTRYTRQIALPEIGEQGQQKLQNARVLVIGAGGLGCPVLQNLAAAGVGFIGIVDGDIVEETNLHRQLLYTLKDCGKSKAATAATVIKELNPDVEVRVFPEFFNTKNAIEIVGDYQIIVDCTDTISVRYLINDVSLVKKVPVVYASIYKFEGQVSVFNYKNGPSYRCLFPQKEGLNAVPNCVSSGVLGILPNTLGALQATEVLKIILEIGSVLSGKLLIYDALQYQTQIIDFTKNPREIEKGLKSGFLILNKDSDKVVMAIRQETFLEKCRQDHCVVIDIREAYEEPKFNEQNVVNVPLAELENYCRKFDKKQEIVLFCQSGQRSQLALDYLKKEGFTKLSHLEKGIESIKIHLETK